MASPAGASRQPCCCCHCCCGCGSGGGRHDGLCNEVRSSGCLPGNEYHEVLQQPLRALEEDLLPVSILLDFQGLFPMASMNNSLPETKREIKP